MRDNPGLIRPGFRPTRAETELRLLSGDEVDVALADDKRFVLVEVKSIRSGWDDMQRGIYQCVKYRAVMQAQMDVAGDVAEIEAVLVTEAKLPADLAALAKRLGVSRKVVTVNHPEAIAAV